ncbi:GNAT family N-acetyltransferase [Nocardia sp. NPDC003963]
MTGTDGEAERGPAIRPLGQPGDLGWVVQAHGELYAAEFGWDTTFEALVAEIVAGYATEHDPTREAAWIATLDGERVGCVLCARGDTDDTAKLRILLVHPKARGHGLGERLVTTCLDFARTTGYQRITLWTNSVLASARRIYRATGFELDDEHHHRSFGRELVGQNWSRQL